MGRWQVSSLGRVRTSVGKVYFPSSNASGYRSVCILRKRYPVNRLVALNFKLPRVASQTQVNHKNLDTCDDSLPNLEWASPSENIQHSFQTNLNRKSGAPKKSKPVCGRKYGSDDEWVEYESASDASRSLGVDVGSVSACCSRRRPQAKGYEFRFGPPTEPEVMPGEEWRSVQGSKSFVSSFGRVRNKSGVVSTPSPQKDGYVRVKVDGTSLYIHRLVAVSFGLAKEDGQDQVNHKDGNRSNNVVENLEWVTGSQNIQHSYETNLSRKSSAPKRSKPVCGRRYGSDDEWVEYESVRKAALLLSLDKRRVSNCCTKRVKQTGGYEFEFVEQEEGEMEGEVWVDVTIFE